MAAVADGLLVCAWELCDQEGRVRQRAGKAPIRSWTWPMRAGRHDRASEIAELPTSTLLASEIGRSLGEAHTTVKQHLDILCGAFVMRQLPPWFQNIGKRQVKSPKVYLRDSGLLHELLGVSSFRALEAHPKLGASWEGFALEEVLRVTDREAYFWNTQGGAALDLLLFVDGKRFGFEFKYADAPSVNKSLAIAREDLGLARVFVVHPGAASWPSRRP